MIIWNRKTVDFFEKEKQDLDTYVYMNFLIDVNIEGKAHDQIFGDYEKWTYKFHINESSFSF